MWKCSETLRYETRLSPLKIFLVISCCSMKSKGLFPSKGFKRYKNKQNGAFSVQGHNFIFAFLLFRDIRMLCAPRNCYVIIMNFVLANCLLRLRKNTTFIFILTNYNLKRPHNRSPFILLDIKCVELLYILRFLQYLASPKGQSKYKRRENTQCLIR